MFRLLVRIAGDGAGHRGLKPNVFMAGTIERRDVS